MSLRLNRVISTKKEKVRSPYFPLYMQCCSVLSHDLVEIYMTEQRQPYGFVCLLVLHRYSLHCILPLPYGIVFLIVPLRLLLIFFLVARISRMFTKSKLVKLIFRQCINTRGFMQKGQNLSTATMEKR